MKNFQYYLEITNPFKGNNDETISTYSQKLANRESEDGIFDKYSFNLKYNEASYPFDLEILSRFWPDNEQVVDALRASKKYKPLKDTDKGDRIEKWFYDNHWENVFKPIGKIFKDSSPYSGARQFNKGPKQLYQEKEMTLEQVEANKKKWESKNLEMLSERDITYYSKTKNNLIEELFNNAKFGGRLPIKFWIEDREKITITEIKRNKTNKEISYSIETNDPKYHNFKSDKAYLLLQQKN